MNEIVRSLQKHKLTKDIKKLLSSIDPFSARIDDMSQLFYRLYNEDLIGEHEFLAIETKFILHQYCLYLERNFANLHCGVYLYDENETKIWNAASPNVPQGYVEYANGLCVKGDILEGANAPLYVKNILAISDVERSENIIAMNHQTDLLDNGLNSFCATPLLYEDKMIGHTVMFSKLKREFTESEKRMFLQQSKMIERRLLEIKRCFIEIISKSNMA